MNFPLNIARRYLFGKKSTNAINILTWISITGIAVGTAVLLLVLSVFNGLEELIQSLYSSFQPDVMVTPKQGKVFVLDDEVYRGLLALEEVERVSRSLEETAFFEYKGSQGFGVLKGVDEQWHHITGLDSLILEGEYKLLDKGQHYAVVGAGIRRRLGVSVQDYLSGMAVFMLKNKEVGPFEQPFKKRSLQPAGVFMIQEQFDGKYILSDLAFAQQLRGYGNGEISQLEISLAEEVREGQALAAIQQVLGEGFDIRTQYEQNEAFFKLMRVEKWMGFAITLLVLINMVSCILMIAHDKRRDISILKSMGAGDRLVQRIFLFLGLWITGIGMAVGFALGTGIYAAHKAFNLVPMQGFIVEAYPASMRLGDFLTIALFVTVFGLAASLYPAYFAAQVGGVVRED